ncbi:MAG: hypothetical protein V7655_11040 [Aequorivita antarctica]
MKELKILTALLIAIIAFSCSSDDDNANPKSGFTIDNNFFSTPKGYLVKNIDTNNRWERIYISNAKLLDITNYPIDCNYSDNLKQDFLFYLLDTDIMNLQDGSYNFTLDVIEHNYEVSKVRFRYNMEVYQNCLSYSYKYLKDGTELLKGNIALNKSGNIFDMEYSFGIEGEIYVNGNYQGELEVIPHEKYYFLD